MYHDAMGNKIEDPFEYVEEEMSIEELKKSSTVVYKAEPNMPIKPDDYSKNKQSKEEYDDNMYDYREARALYIKENMDYYVWSQKGYVRRFNDN